MAPPPIRPIELPVERHIRRQQERAAEAERAEAARRAREVPTRSMLLAAELKRHFDVVYNEHEELRKECDRRIAAYEGPHYSPFDARCQPGKNQRDAFVETSGFRNKIYPEKMFLEKKQEEALNNARRIWDLTDKKRAKENVDDEMHECEEIDSQIRQKLISSNLTFYISLWDTARSECDYVTALVKKFYWYEKRYKPSQEYTSTPSAAALERRRQYEPEPQRQQKKDIGTHGKIWGPWRIWSLDAISAEEQRDQKRSEGEYEFVKRETTVDIVSDNQAEWIKISNITNKRITRVMAEMGVGLEELEDTDEEEEEEDIDDEDAPLLDASNAKTKYNPTPRITPTLRKIQRGWIPRFLRDIESDDELVDLLKFAVQYSKAAPVNRVRYQAPRIRFVCPKIDEGKNELVDRVLRDIRDLGIDVCTIDNISLRNAPDVAPRPFCTALGKMMPNPYILLPKELNLDCTILIGLVSEISHRKDPPKLEEYAPAIRSQIDLEKKFPLLVKQLFPIVKGRQLYCTYEAADRFCSIASLMATTVEKQRTALLIEKWIGERGREEAKADEIEKLSPKERLERLRELSDYDIPDDIQLPVKIINDTEDVIVRALSTSRPTQPPSKDHPYLPKIASQINLQDINHSVFLYAWATGLMTLTSNRVTAKEIQFMLERYMDTTGENVIGPKLWVTDVARSYITKGIERPDKPKKEKKEKKGQKGEITKAGEEN